MLCQVIFLERTQPIAAHPQSNPVSKSKKSTKKKKRSRSQSVSAPLVLPTLSAAQQTSAVRQQSLQPPLTQRNSKGSVNSQSTHIAQDPTAGIQATTPQVTQTATVNLRSLSAKRKNKVGITLLQSSGNQLMPAPGTIEEVEQAPSVSSLIVQAPVNTISPLVPSPAPALSFQGEFDEAKGGGPSVFSRFLLTRWAQSE